ncbi:MAG: hypothetical protein JKX79_10725 [Labilibaculum sp.]|nr:hypothetical protein [Labilibaculum sp.]
MITIRQLCLLTLTLLGIPNVNGQSDKIPDMERNSKELPNIVLIIAD